MDSRQDKDMAQRTLQKAHAGYCGQNELCKEISGEATKAAAQGRNDQRATEKAEEWRGATLEVAPGGPAEELDTKGHGMWGSGNTGAMHQLPVPQTEIGKACKRPSFQGEKEEFHTRNVKFELLRPPQGNVFKSG